MNDALSSISTKRTPQGEKARADQVKNSAGGYTFQVGAEDRLRRFLVLGTDGGTYYTGEKELTRQNAQVVFDYAENDPRKLVDVAVEISDAGRAPKNNPAIFALAAASRLAPNAKDRAYASSKLSKVCRTGTHLFTFAQYADNLGGWGPSLRKAVGRWYTEPPLDKVGLQAVKYRQRNGWTHRDLLRLAHPKTDDVSRKQLFEWITHPDSDELGGYLPNIVEDFLAVQGATTAVEAVKIIDRGNGVTWEMLPTGLLNEADVWNALLDQGMPMTALIRQLPRLTKLGVAKGRRVLITGQLSDQDAITRSRIHPVNVLVALKTYAAGHSERGTSSWDPDTKIIDTLDGTFYKAFGNVVPADKRTLIALDVSGSMGSPASGLPITCREATAAMSLVTMATEPDVTVIAFTGGGGYSYGWSRRSVRDDGGVTVLNISARQRLDDVVNSISGLPFGTTDCSLPFQWAERKGLVFDTVLVMTDNETWSGSVHPHQALESYRRWSGVRTKSIVAAFTATDFTIADPKDPDSLDICGLDSAVPNLIADFSRGL